MLAQANSRSIPCMWSVGQWWFRHCGTEWSVCRSCAQPEYWWCHLAQSSARGWGGEPDHTRSPCLIPAACVCQVSLKAKGMRLQPIDCHARVVQKTALMCCSDHSRAEHHHQLFRQMPSRYIWVLCKLSVKQTIFLILFSHAMGFSLREGVRKRPLKLLQGRNFLCSCL